MYFLRKTASHFLPGKCQECRNSPPSNCKEFKFEENWDLIFLRPNYTSYMMDISKHILKQQMKMKLQRSNQLVRSQVNVAFTQTGGSQVRRQQNDISEYCTPKLFSRKLLLKRMKMKKVIKLIFSFATIKPMINLATYSFQVITNYFNIRK